MIGPQVEGLSKESLQRLYVDDERATLKSVGAKIGCSPRTVGRWIKRHGLPMKPRARWYPKKPETQILADKDWLENELKTKSGKQIALEIGTRHHNIWYWKKRHGLQVDMSRSKAVKDGQRKRYPDGPPRGPDTSNWRGGRRMQAGYVYLYAPDHPNAVSVRYVAEHRLVMEKELGRYLETNEVVHHLDGDKENNDPSNLIVKKKGQHISDHFKAGHEVIKSRKRIADRDAKIEKLQAEVEALKAKLVKVNGDE